ncbi:MAG: HEAT repeat domain-containing protein [Opitutaceae bacterium]|nr:HEAT repeat domain-containing protein [Opitutaceae bacterium]
MSAGSFGIAAVLAFLLLPVVRAQPLAPPKEHVTFPDALSPQASLAAIHVPDDLVVELVASEPAVQDPIDLAWGADGRLWVVEMGDYPLGVDGKGGNGGRIRVLESTKHDGRFDRSTLFIDGLHFPTAVMPWRDGVLVIAAPELLFLRDTDGDGRADERRVLFDGLGVGNQQHQANGLQWGLDGWVYVANGGTRGSIVSKATGVSIDMTRDVRIRPDDGEAEPLTGRSQFGRNRDDWGSWFGCNNANPVWNYALEDRYLRRNPSLVPPNPVVTVPEIPGAAPVYPRSRTLARFNNAGHFNAFTSACGVTVLRDEALGPAYTGNVFVCEPVHNLVHREILSPLGATFRSHRAPGEEKSEFLASTDNWSRFTSIRVGPDGAIYLPDMYRRVIEHPQYIPEAWLALLGDLRQGWQMGRIYRVRRRDAPLREVQRLDLADAAGLAVALASPSGTVRDLAQQQWVWRGSKWPTDALERLLDDARPETRVQVLCTLDLVHRLTPSQVIHALGDAHPGVRRQAIRLSEQFSGDNAMLARLIGLAGDPNPLVRQQLGYSLGFWKEKGAGEALLKLVEDKGDAYLKAAAMSSAPAHLQEMVAALSPGQSFEPALIDLAAGADQGISDRMRGLLTATRSLEDQGGQFRDLGRFLDVRSRKLKDDLAAAPSDVQRVIEAARVAVSDETADVARRSAAAGLLARDPARRKDDVAKLAGLMAGVQTPFAVQLVAANRLAQLPGSEVADLFLKMLPECSPKIQEVMLDRLVNRPEWAVRLLDHLEKDPTMVRALASGQRLMLTGLADPAQAERARRVLNASSNPDRQRVIDTYLGEMSGLTGNAKHGREEFLRICAACHRLGKIPGGEIGPDLASLADRSAPYVVTHVLDPNRVVEGRYQLHTIEMADGRTLAGMLVGEAGNSLTLGGLDGSTQTLLRGDIRSITATEHSLMPEGLESSIDAQGMSDLVAFLEEMGGQEPQHRRRARAHRDSAAGN